MEDINFYGWDIIKYYWYLFQHFASGWPWQILVAYTIVIGCIFIIIGLAISFAIRVRKRNKEEKKQKHINEKYWDTIKEILCSVSMPMGDMLELLKKCDDEDEEEIKKNAKYFIPILVTLRTEMGEVAYFPCLQDLATITGVREYCEYNLLKNTNVFNTLQVMTMLQLVVSEGRLANYVNHKNNDIRMMARLSYIVCSINNPYKYLTMDLEESQSSMRSMMLHYIFAWMKAQDKIMPNFAILAMNLKNDEMAGFLIREIAYWGSDEDKKAIPSFFTSVRYECRKAAIQSAYLICNDKTYQQLIDIYDSQTEDLKIEILKALSYPKKVEYNNFFLDAYKNSVSLDTKEMALTSLYHNGPEGRRMFATLQGNTTNEEDLILMNKIDSLALLNMIYKL